MPRYRLRTLLIVMLLGGPFCALAWKVWTSPEWQTYRNVQDAIAARKAELKLAKSLNTGAVRGAAGQRHAELRLRRDDEFARKTSFVYRITSTKVP